MTTAAPSGDATQELTAGDYTYTGTAGTSIAAPHVSGVLALLASIEPGTMNLATARLILKLASHDAGVPGWDADFGFGIIDTVDALEVFELIRTGRLPVEPSGFATKYVPLPMTSPGVEPSAETAGRTLIAEFTTKEVARVVEAAGIGLGMSVRPAKTGRRRLVALAEGNLLSAERDTLLARPEISAVFYNYLYRPSSVPRTTRSR